MLFKNDGFLIISAGFIIRGILHLLSTEKRLIKFFLTCNDKNIIIIIIIVVVVMIEIKFRQSGTNNNEIKSLSGTRD